MNQSAMIIGLLVCVCVALLGWWWAAGRGGRRARARSARAGQGELDAEALVNSMGYRVIARQERCVWWIEVDGVREEVELRADLILEKDGDRFVAEVKTGELAPDPAYPPTRRQLLEYSLAFAPYTVLLIDVEQAEVMTVRFPRASLDRGEG
jgi:hypothetical protein